MISDGLGTILGPSFLTPFSMRTLSSPDIPAGLALAEQVLERLKPLAQGTPLWEDSAWTTNEMLQRGPSFAGMVLSCECAPDEGYERFLHKHWLAAEGAPADSTNFFVAKDPSPRWLTLRTRSRLGYRKALVDFAKALNGLPVSLEESRSWTWEPSAVPGGRSRHSTVYVLTVYLAEKRPFQASAWLRNAGQDLCASEDPRADRCAFELVAEAGLPPGLVISWSPTVQGLELTCSNLAAAQRVGQAVFADCAIQEIEKPARSTEASLKVALP